MDPVHSVDSPLPTFHFSLFTIHLSPTGMQQHSGLDSLVRVEAMARDASVGHQPGAVAFLAALNAGNILNGGAVDLRVNLGRLFCRRQRPDVLVEWDGAKLFCLSAGRTCKIVWRSYEPPGIRPGFAA